MQLADLAAFLAVATDRSFSAAARTLRRVDADTLAPSVKVRDTADRDTPASSATLCAEIGDLLGLDLSFGKVLARSFAQN